MYLPALSFLRVPSRRYNSYQKYGAAAAGDFQKKRTDRGQAVNRQLATAREEERAKNRAGMNEVIKVITFGAMNGLPFRGH